MTPDEARAAARSAAEAVASGRIEVAKLFRLFMGLLHDLCRDGSLSGHYLALFEALDSWRSQVAINARSWSRGSPRLLGSLPLEITGRRPAL
jgi:hypothetical protein